MNYANILAKKCQKNAASTNLGRFPIPTSTILARFSSPASTNLGRFSPPASTNLARFPIPASTNLGRFSPPCIDQSWAIPHPCIDQSWAIYHNKKDPQMRVFFWYPEPGSNRHGLLHWCLRPARLPIPPSGQTFVLCGQTFVHCGKLLCINFPLKSQKITCRARCFLRAEKGGFEPPVRLPVRQFSKLLV